MIVWNEEHTQQLNPVEIDLEKGMVYKESDGVYTYHIYTAEEKKSIKERQLLTEIGNRQVELQQTDYVVIKIYEATIDGEDTTSLMQEYASVIARRKQLRQEINALQEQLSAL